MLQGLNGVRPSLSYVLGVPETPQCASDSRIVCYELNQAY